jgi:F-type H+-transporting ATPase subunit b
LAGLASAAVGQLGVNARPVLAQEAGTAEHDQATAERAEAAGLETSEEHGAGEGMPQLDASTYASQILWLILTFSLLYYLLKTKALPRVADILEARQERISNDLDRAANLKAEADAAYEEYEKVVADAQARASEAIKAARDAVAADVAGRTSALDKELGAKIASAERSIDSARQQTLVELENVAVELAQAATEKLAGVKVDAAEAKAALAEIRAQSRREVA